MKTRFFKCNRCGQIVTVINDTKLPLTCCMAEMEELVPNMVEASSEKHIPEVKVEGCLVHVTIGSEPHPMTEAHYIQWIAIETNKGIQIKHLSCTDSPKTCFSLVKDECVTAIYEYCSVHGLWVKELNEGKESTCK